MSTPRWAEERGPVRARPDNISSLPIWRPQLLLSLLFLYPSPPLSSPNHRRVPPPPPPALLSLQSQPFNSPFAARTVFIPRAAALHSCGLAHPRVARARTRSKRTAALGRLQPSVFVLCPYPSPIRVLAPQSNPSPWRPSILYRHFSSAPGLPLSVSSPSPSPRPRPHPQVHLRIQPHGDLRPKHSRRPRACRKPPPRHSPSTILPPARHEPDLLSAALPQPAPQPPTLLGPTTSLGQRHHGRRKRQRAHGCSRRTAYSRGQRPRTWRKHARRHGLRGPAQPAQQQECVHFGPFSVRVLTKLRHLTCSVQVLSTRHLSGWQGLSIPAHR